ncbi:hypothetical protein HPB47_013599 [Ixodes persulcatus]|uniref:Uncharacterized protein n=1 Tax=Ixodes persulcatus TaxID=34615 RepID=A0AC60R0P1_IXOPE|nr:hypothetical protein HPB47_013599 [Ixodes persulcatus]
MNAKLNQLITRSSSTGDSDTAAVATADSTKTLTTENNTNSAMERRTRNDRRCWDKRTGTKKRALEYARERRVNARQDSLEERQDRIEQTMKTNYETLSQAIQGIQTNLYDETMDAGYQLLNDPNAPTRNGTSSQRDTNPDLAFISTASAPRGVTWRNTGETLGSDHCLLEITITIAESTQRAQQQQIDHANDPCAYYVDAAKYPHRPNTYAAAVIAADTGVLTTSGSIRCKSPTQAEEFAIALALAIPDCRTVLSDSKPAIVNFATNNVHGTTARVCSMIARPETNVTVKWFPAHAGELDAGPNRNEEADMEAHALTSRGSPSTHSSEPQRPDSEDDEYSLTTYGEVLQWYRTSRRLYPPPHRDLQRSEAATLRQLQVQAIWTPVWAKHVCPEVYTTDICQHCKKARATQRHLLWDCAPPPPGNQEAMPTALSSKIISQELGDQRDVVQHVLSILERQRPKAAPPRG